MMLSLRVRGVLSPLFLVLCLGTLVMSAVNSKRIFFGHEGLERVTTRVRGSEVSVSDDVGEYSGPSFFVQSSAIRLRPLSLGSRLGPSR